MTQLFSNILCKLPHLKLHQNKIELSTVNQNQRFNKIRLRTVRLYLIKGG